MRSPGAAFSPRRLLVVIGTRPEAIKLAPVVLRAQADDRFEVTVVRTSQHQQMLDQIVDHFRLPVAMDLDVMRHDQELSHVTATALLGLERAIVETKPDCVVVQGDTTSTFAGALAAFYQRVPVAHVEAGLRTYDKTRPFPEEINRCLVSKLADYHFAPTAAARQNLLNERVDEQRIWVTGNTAIDALHLTLERARASAPPAPPGRTLLITAHRRESIGEPLRDICRAILAILDKFPDVRVVYPVHLNPRVRKIVFPMLEPHPRVDLVDPQEYGAFVMAMANAHIILTDSGGIQEEAPSLGRPVLILRNTTERPEVVEAGSAQLVGTDTDHIVEAVARLLTDEAHYKDMATVRNVFGDGKAAERILDVLA